MMRGEIRVAKQGDVCVLHLNIYDVETADEVRAMVNAADGIASALGIDVDHKRTWLSSDVRRLLEKEGEFL